MHLFVINLVVAIQHGAAARNDVTLAPIVVTHGCTKQFVVVAIMMAAIAHTNNRVTAIGPFPTTQVKGIPQIAMIWLPCLEVAIIIVEIIVVGVVPAGVVPVGVAILAPVMFVVMTIVVAAEVLAIIV